jgi:YcxB-like protein
VVRAGASDHMVSWPPAATLASTALAIPSNAVSPGSNNHGSFGLRPPSTKHYDSNVSWSAYIGWSEGQRVFVLFPQPRIYVPIPKRAFNEEQLAEFREILKHNIVKK